MISLQGISSPQCLRTALGFGKHTADMITAVPRSAGQLWSYALQVQSRAGTIFAGCVVICPRCFRKNAFLMQASTQKWPQVPRGSRGKMIPVKSDKRVWLRAWDEAIVPAIIKEGKGNWAMSDLPRRGFRRKCSIVPIVEMIDPIQVLEPFRGVDPWSGEWKRGELRLEVRGLAQIRLAAARNEDWVCVISMISIPS